MAEHKCWPEKTADRMGTGRKLALCFKWSAWDSNARSDINIEDLLSRHCNTALLPMPVFLLIKSPLVEVVTREYDFIQLTMLCESLITLLELTAQAAGEWLASQR
jgi:hypothetical protein